MKDRGPYSRIYHSIADDPMFEKVYANDRELATWLRMLLIADAMYPTSAPMPRRTSQVTSLLASGLVVERPGNRYTIRGLEGERERRAASARIGAAVRWHSERNAEAMPRRDETSKDKTSSDANASERPAALMGFRPRGRRLEASLSDITAQHEAQWEPCAQCGQRRGGLAHAPGNADHPFQEKVKS